MHSEIEKIDVDLVDNLSFNSSIEQLYQETCCDTTTELPHGFRDLYFEDRCEVLSALNRVAEDIIENYQVAKPLLPAECPELRYFEAVIKNCEVILSLSQHNWSEEDLEYSDKNQYFDIVRLNFWHKIINGRCIEDIDFNTFSHVLDCDNEYFYTKYDSVETIKYDGTVYCIPDGIGEGVCENYTDCKITPVHGFGMAMYALLLRLISDRYNGHAEPSIIDGEIFYPDTWEQLFRRRIDWKNGYDLEEDSWKVAYLSSNPEPPTIEIEEGQAELLSSLCGRRVFKDIFSSANFPDIVSSSDDFLIGFDQYLFIHDNSDKLERIYNLLVKETEFLYTNIQRITECFENKYQAETMQNYSTWRAEEKRKNNERLHFIYSSLDSIHYATVQRLLFERSGFAYDHLTNQPIIYSEVVEEYIKRCIVQDEHFKLEIGRAIKDFLMQSSESKQAHEKVEEDQAVYEAVRRLQNAYIIDEGRNILLKKEGGKYYKTTELTNYLTRNEFVVPEGGWESFISSDYFQQDVIDGNNKWPDGRIREEFYKYQLHKVLGKITKKFVWTTFKNKFLLQGQKLDVSRLQYYFNSNNEEKERIIANLLRKYSRPIDEMVKAPHVTIRKTQFEK